MDAWLRRYVDAYLTPLVHCFYAHDLVFMPHGENVILVVQDHVPVRAFMKDIAEESSILNPDAALPENARRLAADVPEEYKLLTIFVDVFEGYFRHLSHILAETGLMQEDVFWELVAGRVAAYQEAHPQRLAKYRQYDLYAPDMIHSCLNPPAAGQQPADGQPGRSHRQLPDGPQPGQSDRALSPALAGSGRGGRRPRRRVRRSR